MAYGNMMTVFDINLCHFCFMQKPKHNSVSLEFAITIPTNESEDKMIDADCYQKDVCFYPSIITLGLRSNRPYLDGP